mmetsp:Transcript_27336/g.33519  ORF Transcript_27336/g.33519 Transcript_27336/m.33519 type:complete len:323 (-) Transcript_27336:152-1120(-)|eukprot:CAMPEP_0194387362 /NCGR_PEP_ID=MMETSP0174-20130528/91899_1 /TAXON_ID=216777 /ORGANISM="Proboscia alata, Strain PI-D3" /LENGTH=322 /DNA_ID=CAMNT_0039177473 /DNA_START=55 /DNA_END=1023 /DNA_ORIENTATION=+
MSETKDKPFTIHSSLSDLVSQYDGFILDQFGVMHNGSCGLPGAPECVEKLAAQNKKFIILSNTSSSSKATIAKLPKLGFDPINFEGAVTSGEEAGLHVSKAYQSKKVLWFTWANGATPSPLDFLARCGSGDSRGIEVADSIEDADFIIAHGCGVIRGSGKDGEAKETSLGSFHENGDFSILDPVLEQCAKRNLPMVCANPDFIMVKPDGSKGHMPGKIGQRYESMGGKCEYFGKPHVPHFEACLRDLGLDRNRVAHVGDSLHHDVAGANNSGIASIFVTGGIHSEDLGSPELGALPTNEALQKLFKKEGQTPTHVIPLLRLD